MKCLDNIYTKQIKYNSPVLYQLESLKKEYEKLLKVSNEIIKTGSFIEECYFENQSAVLSDNEITFSGNLKFKTDAGNYFSNIPSSLKLNVQGTGEIVVDVGEDNKTLVFKLDEEFLSEISLMTENLETLSSNFNELNSDYESLKAKFNSQIFDNFIGIRNTSDLKIDQIKHINNNFQITSNDGKSLLNIDEQLEKIYSFNKEIAFTDADNITAENVASWKNKLGYENIDIFYQYDSEDSNINWGFTSGISTWSINRNVDNKYKGFKVTANLNGWGCVFLVDLTMLTSNKYEGFGFARIDTSGSDPTLRFARLYVNDNKTQINIETGYYFFSAKTLTTDNSSYKILKIEGLY